MTAFATALARLFADPNLSMPAIYTPASGAAVATRAMRSAPDEATDWSGGRVRSDTVTFRVAVADVPYPRPGDSIVAAGETRIVQGEPMRDVQRLTWTLDTRPVPAGPPSTFPMVFPITLA